MDERSDCVSAHRLPRLPMNPYESGRCVFYGKQASLAFPLSRFTAEQPSLRFSLPRTTLPSAFPSFPFVSPYLLHPFIPPPVDESMLHPPPLLFPSLSSILPFCSVLQRRYPFGERKEHGRNSAQEKTRTILFRRSTKYTVHQNSFFLCQSSFLFPLPLTYIPLGIIYRIQVIASTRHATTPILDYIGVVVDADPRYL